jgi:hypothetical protein
VGNFPIILFCLTGRGGKTFGGPVVLPRRGVTKGLVNAVVVVVVHPPGNGGLQLVEVVVGAEVNQLAFKRAPQSLNEDVVHPPAATIHAHSASFGLHRRDPFLAGELTSLVGVEDTRSPPCHRDRFAQGG